MATTLKEPAAIKKDTLRNKRISGEFAGGAPLRCHLVGGALNIELDIKNLEYNSDRIMQGYIQNITKSLQLIKSFIFKKNIDERNDYYNLLVIRRLGAVNVNIDEYKRPYIENNSTDNLKNSVSNLFHDFLKRKHKGNERLAYFLDDFIQNEMPELEASFAVKELRRQIKGADLSSKNKYPGRRSGVDSIDFLLKNYGEEIKYGIFSSGQLRYADVNLYYALRDSLNDEKIMNEYFPSGGYPESVSELFGKFTENGNPVDVVKSRIQACAKILDASEEDAARFFSRLRVDQARDRGANKTR